MTRRPERGRPETRVDRVLPDVPAVDRAFDYLVPDELAADVDVGTIVRVPLHGRRVRGWVLERDVVSEAPPDRLRPILSVSSAGPPADVVELTAFGAWRWAGPRATFLRAASPPNVVAPGVPETHVAVFPERTGPVALPVGRVRVIGWAPTEPRGALIAALLEPAGSTIVVAPDARECDAIADAARAEGREAHVVHSDQADATRTRAWAAAREGACVVVGGRLAAWAPVPDLTGIVLLDDADEALAEERAPAWHAREVAVARAAGSDARLTFVSPVPTVESIELSDAEPAMPAASTGRRGWAMTEIVDLREEPPGAGLLSRSLGPALHRATEDGGRALVVVNRKGRARLLVCRTCGTVAVCERCRARVAEGDGVLVCDRCAHSQAVQCRACGSTRFQRLRLGVTGLRDTIADLVVRRRVVAVDAASAPLPAFDVAVGTEAVLHRAPADPARPVRLVVLPELDQELFAPRYRATEQALWLLVRAARLVGSSGTLLVQTRAPEHEVLRALRDGDPMPAVVADRERRRTLALPPFGGLAELSGDAHAVAAACDALRGSLTVQGPSAGRALLRAPTVEALCDALVITDLAAARSLGRLRVDVDPLRI